MQSLLLHGKVHSMYKYLDTYYILKPITDMHKILCKNLYLLTSKSYLAKCEKLRGKFSLYFGE